MRARRDRARETELRSVGRSSDPERTALAAGYRVLEEEDERSHTFGMQLVIEMDFARGPFRGD